MAPKNQTAGDAASQDFDRFRREGDPAALTAVFDAVAPDLLQLGNHLARDAAEAEDLVQETFLIAIRKARRWDGRRPVRPWLVGILTHEARRMRRRGGRKIDVDRLVRVEAEGAERAVLDAEVRGQIESAVTRLPERYGEVVRSAVLHGEEPSGIAERLGIAPGTVRVQLHRGLDLLRKALPAGISLGAAGILAPRGLGAVRSAVRASATLQGPALVAGGSVSFLGLGFGGFAMGSKALSVACVAGALVGALLWFEPWGMGTAVQEPLAVAPRDAALVAQAGDALPVDAAAASRSVVSAPVAVEEPDVPAEEPAAALEVGKCRVTGRLTSPATQEFEEPWACFWPTSTVNQDAGLGVPLADIAADGALEMTLDRGLNGDVIFTANGHCIGRLPIVVPATGDLDLGDLVLAQGVSITGTAWHGGERVLPGTPVLAQATFEATPLALMTQRILKRGDGYIRKSGVCFADDEGGFTFEGLEPGVSYALEALISVPGEAWKPSMLAASAGQKTIAPASGVRLESGLIGVTLLVRADGAPVHKAQIMQQLAPEDPRRELGPAAVNFDRAYYTDEGGELAIQVASGHPVYVEARAPGCTPLEVRLEPNDLVSGATIAIDLASDTPTARLSVELVGPTPALLDGSSAVLFVTGSDLKRYRVGPAIVQGGVATFEGLACDNRHAMFFVNPNPGTSIDDLPFERFSGQRLDVTGLKPNEERRVRLEVPQGGRVRLELVGLVEGAVPAFELIEASGNPVRPPVFGADGEGGHRLSSGIDGPGPFLLGLAMPPGVYTLRQSAEGYLGGDVEVEIRAGEATSVVFRLEAR